MSDGLELRWPGKYDADGQRVPIPRPGATLRPRIVYGPGDAAEGEGTGEAHPGWRNRLIEGDNLGALDALVREHAGTVDLVYIDPPFATGGRFDVVSPVGPRPPRGEGRGLQVRQPAYTDAWPGGVGGLLAMLDPRLRLIHALLAPHGSLYVHVDPTMGHAIKLLLDEIFGPGCFQREIVWRIGWVSGFKTQARNWIRNHDLLFFYVKDPARFTFNKRYLPHPPGYRRRDGSPPRGKGVPLCDVWNAGDVELSLRGRDSLDSIQIKSFSTEKTGYATQKNESLLRRIVEASSDPGDLVADLFCGSGTTLAVAEQLGRRWIGCDLGRSAIHIATARLLGMPRTRGFSVETVQRREAWSDAVVEQRARDAWVALAGEAATPLVVVRAQDSTLSAGRAGSAAIAARRWSLPVRGRARGGVVDVGEAWPPEGRGRAAALRAGPQLVIQRELLEPHLQAYPELGLAERARVRVRLHGLAEGQLRVELVGLWYPHPALLPPTLREASLGPLDLVEWWTVGWDEDEGRDDAPVDVVLGRFARDRTLPTLAPTRVLAGSAARLQVRVFDALHREHRVECRLAPTRGRWRVVEACVWASGQVPVPRSSRGVDRAVSPVDQLSLSYRAPDSKPPPP